MSGRDESASDPERRSERQRRREAGERQQEGSSPRRRTARESPGRSPRRPTPTRPARGPARSPPSRGERAAGGEEAHRCRGLRARWAAPCGNSRTSRRPGGAGRRRPVASSRWSRLRRAGGRVAGGRRALPPLAGAAAGREPLTADGAGAPGPRCRPDPAPPRPARASFSPLAAALQAPPPGTPRPPGPCPAPAPSSPLAAARRATPPPGPATPPGTPPPPLPRPAASPDPCGGRAPRPQLAFLGPDSGLWAPAREGAPHAAPRLPDWTRAPQSYLPAQRRTFQLGGGAPWGP